MLRCMDENITPIGVTNYRNIKVRFGIREEDKHRHVLIIGATGYGKSTLMKNMVYADIQNGKGVALIDPHSELATELIAHIPKSRLPDIIYFNPANSENTVYFNPLHKVPAHQHHIVASGLISTFKRIWSDSWGVRMEYVLRYTLLTLLSYPVATLLDIHSLLTRPEFRKHVLGYVSESHIKDFWELEFEKYAPKFRNEVVAPILNKLGLFKASKPLQRVLGQVENGLDLKEIMDNRKILICNLSKGELGPETTAILGGILLTGLQNTALQRSILPADSRVPFTVYADEIQVYVNGTIVEMLSECRKFKLSLIMAHQYIEQLDEPIRKAVFGNVGTVISFKVGATDAEYLAKEFYSTFTESDFIHLPRYHMYLKLMIGGTTSEPFSAISLPPSV